MVPLECLSRNTFQELFKMSEEEFGLSTDGPITMPCDAASMEYMMSLVQSSKAKDIEKALHNSIAFFRCSAASLHNEYAEGVSSLWLVKEKPVMCYMYLLDQFDYCSFLCKPSAIACLFFFFFFGKGQLLVC
ncbi:hypothetical protein BT93_F1838 [Corymbia citriodora subsp. variegata]|nr:hypothetical protein BT93_F1838 [Corymbia citriodora subsp. variegata]